MNRILIASFAISFAATAYSQQLESIDPASVTAQPEQSEPGRPVLDVTPPQMGMDFKRGQHDADARECLQFTTNDQIHRCAEKYRPHTMPAKLVKTTPSAKPVEPAKSDASAPLQTLKATQSLSTAPAAK
ncbi:MAG: hypothetical protein ACXWCY_18035 [Burkholderiales bacterium]